MRKKFQAKFKAFQDLCIDESVVPWRCDFVSTCLRSGTGFFETFFRVCNVKTGYILDLILYTDSNTLIDPDDELKISGYVVKTLMTPYLNLKHTICRQLLHSPALFECIHRSNTGTCRTYISSKEKAQATTTTSKMRRVCFAAQEQHNVHKVA